MVLIFSAQSNVSKQVHWEVQRAFEREFPVIPFRIENAKPDGTLAYYMGPVHWLDALTPPFQQHLGRLVTSARALLEASDAAGMAATRGLALPGIKLAQAPSYECSLLSIVIASVLAEVPVARLTDQDLISGKSLLDLYRAVDKLISQYQEICSKIIEILAETNAAGSFYGSAERISDIRFLEVNRKLLEIAASMREISASLEGLLKKDSTIFSVFQRLSHVCTQISVAEDFLIITLSSPETVPAEAGARHDRQILSRIGDNIHGKYGGTYDADMGQQMINDFHRLLVELNSYKADLRTAIAKALSGGGEDSEKE
jgi:hypothetical protein